MNTDMLFDALTRASVKNIKNTNRAIDNAFINIPFPVVKNNAVESTISKVPATVETTVPSVPIFPPLQDITKVTKVPEVSANMTIPTSTLKKIKILDDPDNPNLELVEFLTGKYTHKLKQSTYEAFINASNSFKQKYGVDLIIQPGQSYRDLLTQKKYREAYLNGTGGLAGEYTGKNRSNHRNGNAFDAVIPKILKLQNGETLTDFNQIYKIVADEFAQNGLYSKIYNKKGQQIDLHHFSINGH